MNKFCANLVCSLIPNKKKRDKVREILLGIYKEIPQVRIDDKKCLIWDGIIDYLPDSYKDFFIKNDIPVLIKKLKRGLDENSVQIIDKTLSKMLKLPDSSYAKFLYVNENDFKKEFQTEEDREFEKLFLQKFDEIKAQYKLSKEDYDMEVFLYHHGLKFANDKIRNYIKNKVFIDAGAYIGDSALIFTKYEPSKIYSFEISDDSCKNYLETMQINNISDEIYSLEKCALSNKEDILLINDDSSMSANVFAQNGSSIKCCSLDHFLSNKNAQVGFIKADVEGSMYKVLQGMEETIKRYRPVLSFAIYHSPEEFFYTKPLLEEITKDLDYTISIECHYSSCLHIYGTVIFAYPKQLED